MQPPQFPRISSSILLAAAIGIVLLFSIADMLMLLSYSSQATAFMAYLNQKIDSANHSENETYKAQVAGYLAYLNSQINALSQQVNLTSQDSLRAINNLTKTNENLLNRVVADEGRIANLTAYIASLNLTDATAPQIVYVNRTVTVEAPVDNRTCRQKIIDEHGLGPLFDIVYCCESRTYGFADECCACYR